MYKTMTVTVLEIDYRQYMKIDDTWYEYLVATGGYWSLQNMKELTNYLNSRLREEHAEEMLRDG